MAGAARAASSVPATYGAAERAGVVADRQPLVRQAEHDLGRDREARQPQRVHLGAADRARRAPRARPPSPRPGARPPAAAPRRAARPARGRCRSARRPCWRSRSRSPPTTGRWRAASSAAACAIAAVTREVAGRDHADAARPRGRVDLGEVVRRSARRCRSPPPRRARSRSACWPSRRRATCSRSARRRRRAPPRRSRRRARRATSPPAAERLTPERSSRSSAAATASASALPVQPVTPAMQMLRVDIAANHRVWYRRRGYATVRMRAC